MRREGRPGGGHSRGTQALVALPIFLAAFALALQFLSHNSGPQPVTLPGLTDDGGLHSERAKFMQMPERALSAAGDSLAHLLGTDHDYVAHNAAVPKEWRLGADFKPISIGFSSESQKLAFMTTTSDSFRQIQLWTQYHRALGVELFYLFVDGGAARPDVMAQLRALPGVTVIPKTPELKYRQEHSRIWNETWLSAFFHKPCNHELFVQQSLNMEELVKGGNAGLTLVTEGIKLARADGADWVLHIDTDELMYPGGAPHYSLQATLATVPADVDNVVFPNYESLPERDDVSDPFTEVTLFKRNFHHVVGDAYFKAYKSVTRGNPNYFVTYGNGKSAARVQPGLRPNGAHRWYNYDKRPREITHETSAVLHYTFNRFSDLISRRDRCDCAPTEADARRCFILPFDRMAFLAASLKTDEELMDWFRQRLVWNDANQVKELVKNGLFYRIYTPQVLIRGFIAMNEAAKSDRNSAATSQVAQPLAAHSVEAAIRSVGSSNTSIEQHLQQQQRLSTDSQLEARKQLPGNWAADGINAVNQKASEGSGSHGDGNNSGAATTISSGVVTNAEAATYLGSGTNKGAAAIASGGSTSDSVAAIGSIDGGRSSKGVSVQYELANDLQTGGVGEQEGGSTGSREAEAAEDLDGRSRLQNARGIGEHSANRSAAKVNQQ